MTKEEAERARAEVSTSSLPPRPAHTVAPSIPPQTDDIDTDWGVESEAVPPVAPMAASAPVAAPVVVPEAVPPRSARASSIPPRAPTVIPSARPSAPPPAPVAEERAPRHIPMRSRTLIGIANPPTPPTPPIAFTPLPTAAIPSSETLADAETARPVVPSVAPTASVASTRPATLVQPVVTPTTAPHELEAANARPQHTSPSASDAELPHSMRVYAWLAAAAVFVAALAYVRLHRSSNAPSTQAVVVAPTQAPASSGGSAIAEPIAATPSATAEAPSPSASAASSDAPAASSDASAASGDAPVASAGIITVTVNSKPPNAQFFHFGKQVGTAPFVVQLKPGERHAYEVGLPGHITRKLVLDGSKTELTVGLREQPR